MHDIAGMAFAWQDFEGGVWDGRGDPFGLTALNQVFFAGQHQGRNGDAGKVFFCDMRLLSHHAVQGIFSLGEMQL